MEMIMSSTIEYKRLAYYFPKDEARDGKLITTSPWDDIYVFVCQYGESNVRDWDGNIPRSWHMGRYILAGDIDSRIAYMRRMADGGMTKAGIGRNAYRYYDPDNYEKMWRREIKKKRPLHKMLDLFDITVDIWMYPNRDLYLKRQIAANKMALDDIVSEGKAELGRMPHRYAYLLSEFPGNWDVYKGVPINGGNLISLLWLYNHLSSCYEMDIWLDAKHEYAYPKAYKTGELPYATPQCSDPDECLSPLPRNNDASMCGQQ